MVILFDRLKPLWYNKSPYWHMTLVLTRFSPAGIIMAADRMVTYKGYKKSESEPTKDKVHKVPNLDAGVSVWGGVGDSDLTKWLSDFIEDSREKHSELLNFAKALEEQAIGDFGKQELSEGIFGQQRASIGFHVAGFNQEGKARFYNINNRRSAGVTEATVKLEHHNWIQAYVEKKIPRVIRNGSWEYYAVFFKGLTKFASEIASLSGHDFRIPNPETLENQAKYLGFQIIVVGGLYQLRGVTSTIGGEPHVLMIGQECIRDDIKTVQIDPQEGILLD